jgi:hypothetical protein
MVSRGSGTLSEPSSTVIESKDKGRMHMRFTPNASYGYLYLTAWIDLK